MYVVCIVIAYFMYSLHELPTRTYFFILFNTICFVWRRLVVSMDEYTNCKRKLAMIMYSYKYIDVLPFMRFHAIFNENFATLNSQCFDEDYLIKFFLEICV